MAGRRGWARPKAGLEWHGSTLLRRVVGLVARGVDGPVVVVRAAGQELPRAAAVRRGRSTTTRAAAARSRASPPASPSLQDRAEHAFVCSTDLPLLHPAYVRAVAPRRAGRRRRAARRRRPPPAARRLLPHLAGRPRPRSCSRRTAPRPAFLLEGADVRVLDEPALLADPALAKADPGLRSVRGVNTPERAAPPCATLPRAGGASSSASACSPPAASTAGGRCGRRRSRAAAQAVGLVLDRHLLAAVNGDQIVRDGELPLAEGDVVAFLSADAGG